MTLLLVGAVVALVAVWTIAAVFVHSRYVNATQVTELVLESAASTFREHAIQTITSVRLALLFVDQALETTWQGRPRLTPELAELPAFSPLLREFTIVDRDGRVVGDTTGDERHYNLKHRADFRALVDDPELNVYIGTAEAHEKLIEPAIRIAVPRRGPDGKMNGIITALIETRYFTDFYARTLFGRSLEVVLRTDHGTPVISYPKRNRPPVDERSGDDQGQFLMASAANEFPIFVVTVAEPLDQVYGRWLRSSAVVLGLAITVTALILIAAVLVRRRMDLRYKLDAALRAATEERHRLADAKFHFLAQLSHELRTPLNAIIGFSSMLSSEPFGPIGNPRYREYADHIGHSGRHLHGVVNNLLDLAKIDSGKFELRDEEFEIAEAIETARILTSPMAQKGAIAFTIDDRAPGCRLVGDPQLVKQMLINLLANAVKFTPENGAVTLTAECTPDGSLRFRIRDTGRGIAEEDIPRILMPFEQAGGGTDTYRGTGLGLPLTKKLADLHRAELEIDSVVGAGTMVTLSFPKERVRPGIAALPDSVAA